MLKHFYADWAIKLRVHPFCHVYYVGRSHAQCLTNWVKHQRLQNVNMSEPYECAIPAIKHKRKTTLSMKALFNILWRWNKNLVPWFVKPTWALQTRKSFWLGKNSTPQRRSTTSCQPRPTATFYGCPIASAIKLCSYASLRRFCVVPCFFRKQTKHTNAKGINRCCGEEKSTTSRRKQKRSCFHNEGVGHARFV